MPGTDRIDVSAINADDRVAGNQAFTFIGTAQFSGRGEVRYEGGSLEFNATGNPNADTIIRILNSPGITAGNVAQNIIS